MAVDSRITQLLADFDTATNNIAARIQALIDKIAAGASNNDEIVAALTAEKDKLDALGKSDTPTA